MNESKRSAGRVALYLGVVGAMLVSVLPAGASTAAAQGTTRRINNFDVAGRFLEVWNKQGNEQNSTYVNGLPITARRAEISLDDGKVYETQWFERAKYEAHPENRAPYDVLLARLGAMAVEGRATPALNNPRQARTPANQPFIKVDKPADTSATKVWFPETGHTVSGKILEYWNRYGGLEQFGFPLSEQFREVSPTDGKTYDVQYFERNKFELHPEKAAPYEVELGLLGVQQSKMTPIAADQLPISPAANQTTTRKQAVIGMSQQPAMLYVYGNNAYAMNIVLDVLDDALIGIDEKDNYYPEQAYYVPTIENGGAYYQGTGGDRQLVVKYKMRRGLKWSDGQELDSNDVVFTYRLKLDPNAAPPSREIQIKTFNVDNPDKYTVIFTFLSANQAKARQAENAGKPSENEYAFLTEFIEGNKPVVDPLYFLVGEVPLPEHVLGRIPANQIQTSTYAREGHVGSGPFKIQSWQSGNNITTVRNEHYATTRPAVLDSVVFRFYPTTAAVLNDLRAGNLDAATSESFSAPTEALDALPKDVVNVIAIPARVWEHIDFNFRIPQLQDRAVREAIITGLNRQRIVDVVYRGRSIVMHSVQPPASWVSLQNPDFAKRFEARFKLPVYNYDPAKANQILDQAGWVRGGDGIRAKGGQRLSFKYTTSRGNVTRENAAQLVQADMRAIGVDIEIAAIQSYPADPEETLANHQFDLANFAWVLGSDPSFGQWRCDQITDTAADPGTNYQGYCNPKVDELETKFGGEIDRTAREPLGAEIQVILATDIALIPLYPRAQIEVVKPAFGNWKTSPGTNPPTHNAAQWFFK